MANITHTSTGATNTPRLLEVNGVLTGLPTANLIMLINNDSMAGYSAGDAITTLPNQHIDPNVPNATGITAYYYNSIGGSLVNLSSSTLGGKKIVKFGNHNNGASPNYYSSCAWLRKTGLYSTELVVSGITSSALFKIDRTYFKASAYYTYGRSFSRLSIIKPRLDPTTGGKYRGVSCSGYECTKYLPGSQHNWSIYNENTDPLPYSIGTDMGIFDPYLNGGWHNVIYVETFTNPKTIKVYVDGVIIINTAGSAPGTMAGIEEIHFGNANTNPNLVEFGGDFAHLAVWARALSADEIARTYNFIKDEYGLT